MHVEITQFWFPKNLIENREKILGLVYCVASFQLLYKMEFEISDLQITYLGDVGFHLEGACKQFQ